jgi:diacylglycerol O-acyltransferase
LLAVQIMRDHERLTAMDAAFLGIESATSPMHVGAVARFGPGPLVDAHGGLDAERVRLRVASALAGLRRYRQRLVHVAGAAHWAWVDDASFDLAFHVRHTALPRPGTDRELRQLAGRIFSQRLDRDHPLWELWLVEGLAGGGWAIIAKVHHCLIDGIGGAALLGALVAGGDGGVAAPPVRPPSALALTWSEARHRGRRLARGTRAALETLRAPADAVRRARTFVTATATAAHQALQPAAPTPLNPRRIGPHRRFGWTALDLDQARRIRQQLGGTVNDVALATVAGALRRFLARRGVAVDGIRDLRALVPVGLRGGSAGGNAVTSLLAELPVAIEPVAQRYRAVCATTAHLKGRSHQAESAAFLEELADAVSAVPLTASLRLAARRRAYNLVVTNVPGPSCELQLLGSPLEAIYPLAPLFETQALGVALFGYHGHLHVGVVADWHAVPDLDDFIADLDAAFAELATAADAATQSSTAAWQPVHVTSSAP